MAIMTEDEATEVTKSGITTNEDGSRYIPASVRADGSVRKEIKIKPGYRPPEDIEKYKNRTAEAFRNRGKSGSVLGADLLDDGESKQSSAAANKNAKRREARKKAAAEKKDEDVKDGAETNGVKKDDEPAKEVDPEVEQHKEAKKLVKKLRQAKELKDKKESGAALLPEQFEKVIRINELIRQLDSLGFNAEGEKKADGQAETKADET
jgi:partner of Y14 and mago protein